MVTLNYFWNRALQSTKNRKYHSRVWKQFILILKINILFFLMTGRSID